MDGMGFEPWWSEFFRTRPGRQRGPRSLHYNGYRLSFPGVKRPGRGVNHSLPSDTAVKNQYRYTSTPPRCLYGLVQGDVTFENHQCLPPKSHTILFIMILYFPHRSYVTFSRNNYGQMNLLRPYLMINPQCVSSP
jgi:hypothetical protein